MLSETIYRKLLSKIVEKFASLVLDIDEPSMRIVLGKEEVSFPFLYILFANYFL
jgi:hypothetical protein